MTPPATAASRISRGARQTRASTALLAVLIATAVVRASAQTASHPVPASAPSNVLVARPGGSERFDSPATNFEFLHLLLEVHFTEADILARRMTALATLRVRSRAPAPPRLRLDAVDLSIDEVLIDGKTLPARWTHDGRELQIPLAPMAAGAEFTLAIRYRVDRPRRGLHFVLPTPDVPDRPLMVYTNAEPLQARYWLPCHDWPDTRWTTEMRITVPRGYTAVGPGALIAAPPPGEDGGESDRVFHWRLSQPTDPHLLGFAVGPLTWVELPEAAPELEHAARVPLGAYVVPGSEEAARYTFSDVGRILRFYERILGVPYPYPSYNHVTVVSHFHGGMEHAGFSMIDPAMLSSGPRDDVRGDRTRYNFVAHMLAHMWFAGVVNYANVREAWLNESFATYLHQLWRGQAIGPDAFAAEMQLTIDRIARFDRPGSSMPLAPRELVSPEAIYTAGGGLVYWKGAWVLHMLRAELGDETFWRCVKAYLTSHANASARTSDLIAAFERASGRSLRAFFDQWVKRDGTPVLSVHYRWDTAARIATIGIRQTQLIDEEHPPFTLPLMLHFEVDGGTREERVTVSQLEQEWSFEFESEPRHFCTDPHGAVLARITEDKPEEMWIAQVRSGPTALARSRALDRLREIATPAAVEHAAQVLHDRQAFAGLRVRAAAALGAIGDAEALRRLLDADTDADAPPAVRAAILDGLSKFPASPTAYQSIVRRLGNDEHVIVRHAALRAVTAFDAGVRMRASVRAAAAAALPGVSRHVREAALDAVEEFDDVAAVEVLLPATRNLGDDDVTLAARLLRVLSNSADGEPDARGKVALRMAELLQEPRPTLRAAAAEALGRLDDGAAAEALSALAERDEHSAVRNAAREALQAIRKRLEEPR